MEDRQELSERKERFDLEDIARSASPSLYSIVEGKGPTMPAA